MTTESKLREALQKYGQHIGDCSVRAWSTPCFCGLDKTLSPQPTSDEGTPTETPRSFDSFVYALYKAGWSAPGDAQHTQIYALWCEIERALQHTGEDTKP